MSTTLSRAAADACGRIATAEGADTRVGAFLDLDHTVLDGSSGMMYVRYMWRRGLIPTSKVLRILHEAIAYKLGRADFAASSREMMQVVAGTREEDAWRHAREWFTAMVASRITESARHCVQHHRRLGHQIALLSAATPFATALAAETLGLDHGGSISTRLEITDGVYTGRIVEPVCYGVGKVLWAQRYADERGIALDRSFFYTDSYSDVPMLRAVGHPVAVNPDRRLRQLARASGWPIVRFY